MADTMQMAEVLCNVVYVDAGIGSPGDGSTPAAAVANIPAIASLVSNTVYLIRRNLTNGVVLTNATLATGNNIFLIGMPLAADWLYSRAPAAAKAAWDADVPAYALVNTATYNTQSVFNPIDRCGFHRLKFTRVSPGSGYGASYQVSPQQQLSINGSTTGDAVSSGEFFFTNNWWCDAGITLSDPAWSTNTPYQSGAVGFFNARSLMFCNNHYEYSGAYNAITWHSSTTGCVISTVKHLIANDNEFWYSSFGSGSNNGLIMFYVATTGDGYIEFCRNNVHLVCQNYSYVSFYQIVKLNSKDIYSHDCTVTVDRYYNRSAITSGSYIDYAFYCYNAGNTAPGKWDIQNITVDSGDICNVSNLVYLYWYYQVALSGPYGSTVIKNISAKCASSGGIASSYGGYALYTYLPFDTSPVDAITAWHYMAGGAYLHCSGDPGNPDYVGAVYKNMSIKGTLRCYYADFVHVTSWTLGSAPAADKLYVDTSNVYIETATIDPGHAWVAQQWLRWNRCYGRVIIDSIDVPVYINNQSTPAYDDAVLVNNSGGVTGKWYGWDYYYLGQSQVGIYRTGGATMAVKFTSPGGSDAHWTHLEMALAPYRGLEWTPTLAGNATVTIHLAHKSMTNPTFLMKRIKVQVLVPYWDGVVGEYQPRTVMGDIEGQLLDDSAAVWNGDSGLTQVRLVIPIVVSAVGQAVTVRLFYDWYDATGYCYIDPQVEFAMV